MTYLSVKEALVKIFNDSENPSEVFKQVKNEDIRDLEIALRKMSGKVYKQNLNKNSSQDFNISNNGQWSLEKAIKPGPTLDYGKIAPEQNPISNPAAAKEAKTARLATQEANAPSINYGGNRMATPKVNAGLADKAKAVRAKIEAESKETALETIQRKQKMNKEEGEPHDDPNHEKKEKQKAAKIKEEAEGILDLHKAKATN
jgi:hypothetical protein